MAIYCVNFGVNFILQKFCMCKKMTIMRYGNLISRNASASKNSPDLDSETIVEDITLRNLRSSKVTINGYLERWRDSRFYRKSKWWPEIWHKKIFLRFRIEVSKLTFLFQKYHPSHSCWWPASKEYNKKDRVSRCFCKKLKF